jgi:peptidoglycan/LPS O-acetylase OafA/YrhL
MNTIKYRPEVDGLRALAVIPVILFHLGFKWIQGGFVGVDVFFVISGYLISLIILREQEQGNFTFRAFWIRRARRIIPALASVILASMVAGFFILFRFDWKALGEQGLSVFALVANFKMWKSASNYWAPAAHETPLLHTWSLAVEEQFYLFYPLLLVTILKFAKQHTFKLILGGTILSFSLCLAVTWRYPAAAFYLLPTRAWELAAGCLLAISTHNRSAGFSKTRVAPIFAVIGAGIIILSFLCISEDRGFPGYQALFPVAGTLMVIAFASQKCLAGRILASSPVSYLGKISYSLYLWHWPVIVYAHIFKQQSHSVIPLYWVVGITLALSIISYHFIEKTTRFSKNWVIPVSILTLSSIAAAAGMYGWRIHYDLSSFAPVVWNGRLYDVTPSQKPWEGFMKDRMTGIIAPLRAETRSRAFAENGIFKPYGGSKGTKPEIVVFGDSHALMWSSTIDTVCKELGRSVSFFAADGTSPDISVPPQKIATLFFTDEEKFLFDSARLRTLTEQKPKLVILAAKYSVSWTPNIGGQLSDTKNGTDFENLVELITRSGAKCLIIEQPPIMPFGDRNAMIQCAEVLRKSGSINGPINLPLGEQEDWWRGRSIIDAVAKKYPASSVLNIADLYLSMTVKHARLLENRNVLYIDDDHLSEYGAMKAKDRIKTKIAYFFE